MTADERSREWGDKIAGRKEDGKGVRRKEVGIGKKKSEE